MSNDTIVMLAYTLSPPCLAIIMGTVGYFIGNQLFPLNPLTPPEGVMTPLAPTEPCSAEDEKLCAEFAVLAWKATKAVRGNQTRALERSLERMLSRLKECGFNVAEYKGQRIFSGSAVKILDTVDGPEDVVLEDLEPEVIRNKKILHQASVIVGKKQNHEDLRLRD